MAAGFTQRRRRKQSVAPDKPDIDDDVLLASAIGDVTWLQQSLWNAKKVYKQTKQHGFAPIHLAAKNGHLESLQVMVERYKVDINLPSETGWTPLHLAINTTNKKKSLKCVQYLLVNGADPSRQTHDGTTPVHRAAIEGHVKCLQLLIRAGGDIEREDNEHNTPMDLARVWGHRPCARILSNHQWYLDKEKERIKKLEEEIKEQELAAEIQRLSLIKKMEGQHESQLAFKRWLGFKGFPDLPSMYGPVPLEERRAFEALKASKSVPNTPRGFKGESMFVVKSKSDTEGFHGAIRQHRTSDHDKKLSLIPLERISASRRHRSQRQKVISQNKAPRMANLFSPPVPLTSR
ncbi:ankyrin repeat domain-containing protein 53 [Nematostella vectensis]|uniref:ankyrin repeat domain-containing protein 53 n=1 Tax=Nematostella vectensis TaxID=45351 RepID=UPI00138FBD81|nr:ankyrin repeat domain-containing protein 53 [Nematostella vectensis]